MFCIQFYSKFPIIVKYCQCPLMLNHFLCICFSGLLLQENERFSEALLYYKMAIGSRPTLACKLRPLSVLTLDNDF